MRIHTCRKRKQSCNLGKTDKIQEHLSIGNNFGVYGLTKKHVIYVMPPAALSRATAHLNISNIFLIPVAVVNPSDLDNLLFFIYEK